MIIGHFTYDPERNSYFGEIRTLMFTRLNVQLLPVRKHVEKEPDYRVVEEGPGGAVEFGAAWRRQSEKGVSFLSVSLDDPTFPSAVNIALFDDRAGKATLVWTRPRLARAAEPEVEKPLPARRRAPASERHANHG